MTVRVDRDGVIVHLGHGLQLVGKKEIELTSAVVAGEGETFADDRVASYVLENAKAGERGVSYVPDEEFEAEQERLRAEAEASTEADNTYDPSAHVQDDVLAYLKTADADEVARVQEAEGAGQRRQKIMAYTVTAEEG